MEFVSKNEENGIITVNLSKTELERIRACAFDALELNAPMHHEEGINAAFFTLSDIKFMMMKANLL